MPPLLSPFTSPKLAVLIGKLAVLTGKLTVLTGKVTVHTGNMTTHTGTRDRPRHSRQTLYHKIRLHRPQKGCSTNLI
jgi:hypothetical protein